MLNSFVLIFERVTGPSGGWLSLKESRHTVSQGLDVIPKERNEWL